MRAAIRALARSVLPESVTGLLAGALLVLARMLRLTSADRSDLALILGWGLGGLVLVAGAGVHGRVRPGRAPAAVGLPGFAGPRRMPASGPLRSAAGLAVLLVAVLLLTDHVLLAAVLLGLAVLAVVGLLTLDLAARRAVPARRAALTRALADHGPEFLVHTARRNDASYQLAMWIPQLEKLGRRYAVVVRDPAAVGWARSTTTAPVVCAPAVADLDAIAGLGPDGAPVVPGLRAAFYVNGVSENVQLVNYRALTHVYLGHGDSDKELSAHPMHAMFDRIFVAGPAAIERYPAARVDIPADKFVVAGRPQLAGLADTARPRSGSGWRVLLAPTWRGYNARTRLGSLGACPALAELLLSAGCEVVFRPHPFSWQGSDRRLIERVDALLAADAAASDRRHLTATDTRAWTTAQVFGAADALVTDVGSLLVDFFATGRPYAVVVPAGIDAASLAERYPSTAAAYPVDPATLVPGTAPAWLTALHPEAAAGDDPLRSVRGAVARHYLGEHPGDDRPFLTAVAALLEQPPTPT